MRVAYVSADAGAPVFGSKGSSVHVQEMLRAMVRDGLTVELFAASFNGEPPADLRDVVRHQLPALREREAFLANDSIAELIARRGPFDLIYERHSLWSYAPMELARDRACLGVLEINAPLIDEQIAHRQLIHRDEAAEAARRAFAAAPALIAVSRQISEYTRRFHRHTHVHVVPNGVDANRFPAKITPRMPAPGTFTIGFVGSLKPWHGIDTLVEIFDRLPGARLLVVGDGPERAKLERTEAVLTGAVTPADVPPLLASMDVTVAPYPAIADFYFSPLKIVESMAAAVPVVASRIGDIPDLVRDGVDGILCRPGNVDDFVSALDRLRNDPALRQQFGSSARRRVLERHTWEGNWRRIREIAMTTPAEGRRR